MRKIISAILSICMIISVLTAMNITVSADGGGTAAEAVYYCGERLDEDTPYLLAGKPTGASSTILKASETEERTDGEWTLLARFDAGKGTLAFKSGKDVTTDVWAPGFLLKQVDTDGDGDTSDEKYYGIYAKGNLTIDLGDYVNLLYLGRQEPMNYGQEGIHVEGDLTVNGNQKGLLRVTANPAGKQNGGLQSYGIYASGTVTLNGGTLDAYDTTYNLGYFHLEDNKTTYIKASDVKLNGGSLFLRTRNSNKYSTPDKTALTKNKKLHEIGSEAKDYITVPDSYVEQWAGTLEYDSDNNNRIKGNDSNKSFTENRADGDFYVKYMPGKEVVIPSDKLDITDKISLSDERRYLVKNGDEYSSSTSASGAVAEYDTNTKTLTILRDTSLSVGQRVDGASFCIKSESDITINILEDATLTLNGANIGRNRDIWASGNITIRGEGSLKAFACKDYLGTGEKSAAIWSDSGDVTIEGSVNARLYTRELSTGQVAHVIYAGGNNINIGAYATVAMGTDIGKLFNEGTALSIYENAEAKMAASAETKTTGPEPKSELIDYNSSSVSEMKYFSVYPMPMKVEKITGFDIRNILPLSRPEIELTFNLPVDTVPSVSDLSIDNGAKISGISSSGRNLKILLSDVKADGEYKLKLKNIKNAAGLEYAEEYDFKVSGGCDVLSIKLNGLESGDVKTSNTVSVALSKADSVSEMNAVVTVVVWDKVTVGEKSVKRLKTAVSQNLKNITGTKIVDFLKIAAETDDIIEVFVWNSGTELKTLTKSAEFVNK